MSEARECRRSRAACSEMTRARSLLFGGNPALERAVLMHNEHLQLRPVAMDTAGQSVHRLTLDGRGKQKDRTQTRVLHSSFNDRLGSRGLGHLNNIVHGDESDIDKRNPGGRSV